MEGDYEVFMTFGHPLLFFEIHSWKIGLTLRKRYFRNINIKKNR